MQDEQEAMDVFVVQKSTDCPGETATIYKHCWHDVTDTGVLKVFRDSGLVACYSPGSWSYANCSASVDVDEMEEALGQFH